MNDAAVRDLAHRAGIAIEWIDYTDRRHRVPLDVVRRILTALDLPCDSASDVSHSRQVLEAAAVPALVTATVGQGFELPAEPADAATRARLHLEDGSVADVPLRRGAHGLRVSGIDQPGYHTIEFGERRANVAVAPGRCVTISDVAPGERLAGLAAQVYGLRYTDDCGIGDMAGVTALGRCAAGLRIDALALSPTHALFAADPGHFSPYSPSSRLFYNPLHADAASVLGPARVAAARCAAGDDATASELESLPEIDWPRASRLKMAILRRLFDDFSRTDLAGAGTTMAMDFASFRAAGGTQLEEHARFEALHAARLAADPRAWSWKDWPAQWRDPVGGAVLGFAEKNRDEVLFHAFLQWVADRSLARAQHEARQAGMRIGLIADIAIGTNSAGSYCWTNQRDVLSSLQIGAPPDLFNADGQNWGLTTFSPRALQQRGFVPFLATIRACMRHAGGVRIDHAMGMMHLWVIPDGAKSSEGTYLSYPLDDLLRLTALESHRHRAIVIGEDLGTVPAGFRDRLAATGIYGMRVLWFERAGRGFAPPSAWPADVAAMTSTHDLPTVAGWWRGTDIGERARCGAIEDAAAEETTRAQDRRRLWRAFRRAHAGDGDPPAPQQASRIADAAVRFIAATPSRLALLPLEDALALEAQPNLPGTIDEHPNWRRRYPGDAAHLLDPPDVRDRCRALTDRDEP